MSAEKEPDVIAFDDWIAPVVDNAIDRLIAGTKARDLPEYGSSIEFLRLVVDRLVEMLAWNLIEDAELAQRWLPAMRLRAQAILKQTEGAHRE